MTPEQRFHKLIRDTIPKSWHLQRIESTTTNGIPDLNMVVPDLQSGRFKEVWLEVKALPANQVAIRSEQYSWATMRMAAGGCVMVVNQDPKTKSWSLHGHSKDGQLWVPCSRGMSPITAWATGEASHFKGLFCPALQVNAFAFHA